MHVWGQLVMHNSCCIRGVDCPSPNEGNLVLHPSSQPLPSPDTSIAARGSNSESSQGAISVAPVFVEIGPRGAKMALRVSSSTNIGATDIVHREESASAIHGARRQPERVSRRTRGGGGGGGKTATGVNSWAATRDVLDWGLESETLWQHELPPRLEISLGALV